MEAVFIFEEITERKKTKIEKNTKALYMELWHKRMAHVGKGMLKQLENCIVGMNIKHYKNCENCKICTMTLLPRN